MNLLKLCYAYKNAFKAYLANYVIIGFFLLCCSIRCEETGRAKLRTYNFKDHCSEDGEFDLSMISDHIYKGQLNFRFKSSMPSDFKCTVIIGSNGFDKDRLAFYFTEFDMGDNCGVGETWLMVAEGDLTVDPKPIPGLPVRLCGRTFADLGEDKQFTTEWRHLRIEYHGNNATVDSGFSLVFMHFSDSPCEKWEYSCDNGRCIDKTMSCSGNNPCGDHSDCNLGISTGAVIGIVIGVTVAIGLAIFLYRYIPTCLKGPEDEDRTSQQDETDREMAELAMLPPTYTSTEDQNTHHSTAENGTNSSHYGSGNTEPHIAPSAPHIAPSAPHVAPSAPAVGNGSSRQDIDVPPPSYEMATSYSDKYTLS